MVSDEDLQIVIDVIITSYLLVLVLLQNINQNEQLYTKRYVNLLQILWSVISVFIEWSDSWEWRM